MGMVSEQWAFIRDVSLLIVEAERLGIVLTGGELFRTKEQQDIYLKTGKTKTNNSMHLKRLAVDFNFFIDGKLIYNHPLITQLGKFWELLNELNRWGGSWRGLVESGQSSFVDSPHFERKVNA